MSLKEKKPIIVLIKPGKHQKKYREESILDNDHKENYILKNQKNNRLKKRRATLCQK